MKDEREHEDRFDLLASYLLSTLTRVALQEHKPFLLSTVTRVAP